MIFFQAFGIYRNGAKGKNIHKGIYIKICMLRQLNNERIKI